MQDSKDLKWAHSFPKMFRLDIDTSFDYWDFSNDINEQKLRRWQTWTLSSQLTNGILGEFKLISFMVFFLSNFYVLVMLYHIVTRGPFSKCFSTNYILNIFSHVLTYNSRNNSFIFFHFEPVFWNDLINIKPNRIRSKRWTKKYLNIQKFYY